MTTLFRERGIFSIVFKVTVHMVVDYPKSKLFLFTMWTIRRKYFSRFFSIQRVRGKITSVQIWRRKLSLIPLCSWTRKIPIQRWRKVRLNLRVVLVSSRRLRRRFISETLPPLGPFCLECSWRFRRWSPVWSGRTRNICRNWTRRGSLTCIVIKFRESFWGWWLRKVCVRARTRMNVYDNVISALLDRRKYVISPGGGNPRRWCTFF